jgi:hypothetical protein
MDDRIANLENEETGLALITGGSGKTVLQILLMAGAAAVEGRRFAQVNLMTFPSGVGIAWQ